MRSSTPIAIMLLFVFAALSFGWAFAEESAVADGEGTAATNETVTNETLGNVTNETLMNNTLTNETLKNLTMPQNETGYFKKVRGRQPSRR